MELKIVEIRDEGTAIPVLAIRMVAQTQIEKYYLHEDGGYPKDGSSIVLLTLRDARATNDPYQWDRRGMNGRTMPVAHAYIIQHYTDLPDGAVIDVEYLLGLTHAPKISQRSANRGLR